MAVYICASFRFFPKKLAGFKYNMYLCIRRL